ncbi:hypothetical protein KSP40_PGU016156 [Platanthera guangdongensis]|uniref:Uncharacterized protein n=1 Tax=Platanthera guangdongensis TaxID=2320717 RepID=A0ABR2MYT9_9ASPA
MEGSPERIHYFRRESPATPPAHVDLSRGSIGARISFPKSGRLPANYSRPSSDDNGHPVDVLRVPGPVDLFPLSAPPPPPPIFQLYTSFAEPHCPSFTLLLPYHSPFPHRDSPISEPTA